MGRRRFFRVVRVQLECGHVGELNTGRWRVSRDLAACIVGDAIRRGVWCFPCNGSCVPTKYLGVARAYEKSTRLARDFPVSRT